MNFVLDRNNHSVLNTFPELEWGQISDVSLYVYTRNKS